MKKKRINLKKFSGKISGSGPGSVAGPGWHCPTNPGCTSVCLQECGTCQFQCNCNPEQDNMTDGKIDQLGHKAGTIKIRRKKKF
jgi:hypothetical protein